MTDSAAEASAAAPQVAIFHYRIRLSGGTVVKDTFGQEPETTVIGLGKMIEALEAVLRVMAPGEKRRLELAPEQAYGHCDPEAVRETSRRNLPAKLPIEVGTELGGQGPNELMPIEVVGVSEQSALLDSKQLLVNKTLIIDVELIDRRATDLGPGNLMRLEAPEEYPAYTAGGEVLAAFFDSTRGHGHDIPVMLEALARKQPQMRCLLVDISFLPEEWVEDRDIFATPLYKFYRNGRERRIVLDATLEQLEALRHGTPPEETAYPPGPDPGFPPLYSIYPLDEDSPFDLVAISEPLFSQELERLPRALVRGYRKLCPVLTRWLERIYGTKGSRLLGLAVEPPVKGGAGGPEPDFEHAILHLLLDESEPGPPNGPFWHEELNLAMASVGVPLRDLRVHKVGEIRAAGSAGRIGAALGNSLLFRDTFGLLQAMKFVGIFQQQLLQRLGRKLVLYAGLGQWLRWPEFYTSRALVLYESQDGVVPSAENEKVRQECEKAAAFARRFADHPQEAFVYPQTGFRETLHWDIEGADDLIAQGAVFYVRR